MWCAEYQKLTVPVGQLVWPLYSFFFSTSTPRGTSFSHGGVSHHRARNAATPLPRVLQSLWEDRLWVCRWAVSQRGHSSWPLSLIIESIIDHRWNKNNEPLFDSALGWHARSKEGPQNRCWIQRIHLRFHSHSRITKDKKWLRYDQILCRFSLHSFNILNLPFFVHSKVPEEWTVRLPSATIWMRCGHCKSWKLK